MSSQRLYLETLNGETITLETESLDIVKAKIKHKEGISPERRNLIFPAKKNDFKSDSSSISKSYNNYVVSNNNVRTLVSQPRRMMQIYIKTLTGRCIAIMVESSDTISKVKSKIRDKEGLSEDNQRLIFNGKELQNKLCLLDYSVDKDAVFHLVVRFKGA